MFGQEFWKIPENYLFATSKMKKKKKIEDMCL